jgi:hypothetical protein
VTAGRFFDRRVAARPASDGGDFCTAEIVFERAFQWCGGVSIGILERKFQ